MRFCTINLKGCDNVQNFIKTIINAIQSQTKRKIKDSTADWSQNDSSADNYVKNRTHWEETNEVVLVPEMEIVLDSDPLLNAFDIEFIEGKTYTVVWDGVTYNCIAYIAEGPNAPSIGNGAIGDASGGNGEPFFCTVFDGNVMLFGSEGTHTVQILLSETITHKLDPKYLPDDIGVQADWNQSDPEAKDYIKNKPFGYGVIDTVADETITFSDGWAYLTNVQNYVHYNDEYTILFDNIEYTGIASTDADSCIRTDFVTKEGIRVNGRDSYSFVAIDSTGAITTALDGEHTIKIVVKRTEYSKIKEEDIPESIQREADTAGFIGDGTSSAILNGRKFDKNRATGSYSCVKGYGTEAVSNYSDVSGKFNLKDVVYVDDGGTVTNQGYAHNVTVCYSETAPVLNPKTGKYTLSEVLTCTPNQVLSKTNIFLVIGSATKEYDYFHFKETTDYTYSGKVYTLIGVVKHKPKAIAANKYVHIVGNGTNAKTRSNAHTLDWDGNAWYAGTVEGTAMIIKSSTEGSEKKFKITVDDSGVLSAVEVVEETTITTE